MHSSFIGNKNCKKNKQNPTSIHKSSIGNSGGCSLSGILNNIMENIFLVHERMCRNHQSNMLSERNLT